MMNRFSHIVFDLDGTLVNSLPDIADVINGVLSREGFPVLGEGDYAPIVGWGLRRTLEQALPGEALGTVSLEDLDRMAGEVVRSYAGRPMKLSRPYPGILRILGRLSEQGFSLVVWTNKETGLARSIVGGLLGADVFDAVLGRCDEYPPKPDAQALKQWVGNIHASQSSILMVGDTPVDGESAANAGAVFAGVSWGYGSADELKPCNPVDIFSQPDELEHWLFQSETDLIKP